MNALLLVAGVGAATFVVVQQIRTNKEIKMALKDLLDNIAGWGKNWRERCLVAERAAAASEASRASTQAAFDAFVASDAETDLEQINAAKDADVAEAEAVWAELQALDTPPAEPPFTDPETGEEPKDEEGNE